MCIPSTKMQITATPSDIHEPTPTWVTNSNICVVWPPRTFPQHVPHYCDDKHPFNKHKNWHPVGSNSHPNRIEFQIHTPVRNMTSFANVIVRSTEWHFGCYNVGNVAILKLQYFGRNGEVCVIGTNLSRTIVHGP